MSCFRRPRSLIRKRTTKTEVCSGSGHPAAAMPWIKEVEMAYSVEYLKTSRSISGRHYPNFETLDARIATTLKLIFPHSNFKKRRPTKRCTKAQKEDWFLPRQIAFVIYEYFRVTGTHESILDFCDRMGVTSRRDDVPGFGTRWSEVLLSTHEVMSEGIRVFQACVVVKLS